MCIKKLKQELIKIEKPLIIQSINFSSVFYTSIFHPDGKNIIGEDIYYYLNNKIHNMEGPAVIKKDGTKLYYIKGELLTDINDDESLKRYINLSLFK